VAGGGDPTRSAPRPGTAAGPVEAPPSPVITEPGSPYEWRRLPLGAGGWVTGLVVHAGSGTIYARTDVGGAYRYDRTTRLWTQMLTAASVPAPDPTTDEMAVEAIAVNPRDPRNVVITVGGDENPGEGKPPPTTGRVLVSRDSGTTWTASTTRFFVSGNQAHRQRGERLAFDPSDPQRLLLGTRRQGLWESTDGGATFRQISLDQVPAGVPNGPEQDHAGITFVTFDPQRPGRIYAGVAGVGVYRTDDNGRSWRRVIDVIAKRQVPFEGVLAGGRLVVAITTIEGDEPGHLRVYDPATNSGRDIEPARWSAWSVAVDPANPDHLVASDEAVRSERLWHSKDGGRNWARHDVAIDASSIPWLGATDLAGWMSIGRMVFDPFVPGRLWFAEGMGVWFTDDFAAAAPPSTITWTLESRGIEELVVADIATPPGGGGPITVAADRQGFRSTSLTAYPSQPLVNDTFAGGTDLDYSGRNPKALVWVGAEYHIYWNDNRKARGAFSSDGGATWTELPNLTKNMFGGNVAVSATDPNNIVWLPSYYINPWEYTDKGKGLFVTKNGGRSWQNRTVDGKHNFHRLMWWLNHQGLASDKVDGGVFYLQNDTGEFYVSTDGGSAWTKAANSAPCFEYNACTVFGQLVASPSTAGELWSSAGEAGLFRSTDRGASPWQKIPGPAQVRAFALGAPLRTGGPYALYVYGTLDTDARVGLWRSGDGGATWQLAARMPFGMHAKVTTINGDLDLPGRVYVGFGGSGAVYGDDPTLR
jgi:photosystem II stability/assembly factor-like uncharacterized protein